VNSDFSLHARAARKSMQVLGYTRCTAAVKLAIRKLRSKDCQGNSPIAGQSAPSLQPRQCRRLVWRRYRQKRKGSPCEAALCHEIASTPFFAFGFYGVHL
jgi:hypothetical protein